MSAEQALRAIKHRTFVEAIEGLMAQQGFTKIELRNRVNRAVTDDVPIDSAMIYKVLRGDTRANPKVLAALSQVLSVPVDDLIGLYGAEVKVKRKSPTYAPKPGPVSAKPAKPEPKPKFSNYFDIKTEEDGTLTVSCRVVDLTIPQALAIGQALVDAMPEVAPVDL